MHRLLPRFGKAFCATGLAVLACMCAAPGLARGQTNDPAPKKVYQSGWAGYILYTPDYQPAVIPQHRFHDISAEWIVPSAKPTINCKFKPEQSDGSSIWIGLDGWGETMTTAPYTDVLQAGTETDVPCWDGNIKPATAFFWIEWAGIRNIATFRVNVGDDVQVRIVATTTGPRAWREATVYFKDETAHISRTKTFHSGCLECGNPHTPATLFGNTAEWVVETTFYDADNPKWPNTLNDFGTAQMNNIAVTDDQGITYTPSSLGGASQEIDWMTVDGHSLARGDTLLACAGITGPDQLTLARAPYDIVKPGQQGDLEPKPQTCAGLVQTTSAR